MKGANDTKTIGLCNWSLEKISPTVPPATERKALPKNPLKKRDDESEHILRKS